MKSLKKKGMVFLWAIGGISLLCSCTKTVFVKPDIPELLKVKRPILYELVVEDKRIAENELRLKNAIKKYEKIIDKYNEFRLEYFKGGE